METAKQQSVKSTSGNGISEMTTASSKTKTSNKLSKIEEQQSDCQLLVPINVVSLQRRAEDGTYSELGVESISWAALDAKTGKARFERRTKTIENAAELAEAIEQVSFRAPFRDQGVFP